MSEEGVDMPDEMPSKSQDSIGKLPVKKSWQELRQAVRDIRKKLSNVTTKVPSCFNFRTVHTSLGKKTRLYFLSASANGRETTLLFSDVPDNPSEASPTMVWQPLLESSFQVIPNLGRISKEEQLQWERKRLVTWGITSYELHSDTGRFVFPVCGSLFSCVDEPHSLSLSYFPMELKTSCNGALLNPQICPSDANLVAYIYNNDIWVQNLLSCERRLTFVHRGVKSLAEDPVSAGIPSYVMQEEFNRYLGFWWQPETTTGVYRILYEEIDESEVEIVYFSSPCNEDHGIEEYRFPRAGTSNAKSTIKIVEFELDEKGEIHLIRHRQMLESLAELCPWLEYVVRIGWTPDGARIWAQLLNRRQQHLELILISLESFVLIEDSYEIPTNDSSMIPVQVLLTEDSNVWINVHDVLHFFPQIDEGSLSFIWASEKAGFRHLYFITCDISSRIYHDDDDDDDDVTDLVDSCVKSNIIHEIMLTSGNWEVLDKQIWVDEVRQLVYFMGFKDTPLEKHLYVVSIMTPGAIKRLTEVGYSHSVSMNSERTMFVTVYSNIETAPASQVFQITHANTTYSIDSIHIMSCGSLLNSNLDVANHCPVPELFNFQIKSGEVLYGLIFKPVNLVNGEKYPAVLSVYGGPEVQLVTNTFKGLRQLRLHMLADQGYVVLVIDSRGSRHRGLKFESHLKERMGTVEIQDQVEVLEWLYQTVDYIDFSRLAIHGWSYGGYLSLMGLAQRPDIFKIAVAGAPVTSWSLYDTGYTERYMDLPSVNMQGYRDGSVLSYVSFFPSEENRLLIIHGLIDENVHFFHTNQLINALIRAGKPYQLQVYPNERHSLRHLEASEHYETTLLSFLQTWL